MIPERVKNTRESLAAIFSLLEFEEDEKRRIDEALVRARGFDSVAIKTGLSEEEVAQFAVNRHRFPGFSVAGRLARYYPFGAQLAHVVGYVGRINEQELRRIDPSVYRASTHIGKVGVEKIPRR